MKLISSIIFLLITSINDCDILQLRKLFEKAVKDEKMALELISVSEKYLNHKTANGYYAAGKIILAKYYFNPVSKLKSFNEGRALLESAINADSSNSELRFIRLSIQENTPAFLCYNKNIRQDKIYLTNNLPFLADKNLQSMISKYLKTGL